MLNLSFLKEIWKILLIYKSSTKSIYLSLWDVVIIYDYLHSIKIYLFIDYVLYSNYYKYTN